MTRHLLPTRRPNLTHVVSWGGHEFTVTVGFDPATGQPREVFADTAKGGHMQATIADACVWASIALQHGVTPEGLAKSLGEVPVLVGDAEGRGTTRPASPLGAIADLLVEVAGQ